MGFVVGLLSGIAGAQGTWRVSLDSAAAQGNARTTYGAVGADGRLVVFMSKASNLVPGDTNSAMDVFVRDRQRGTTTRVSVDSAGKEGDLDSYGGTLSADGRLVAFYGYASNLVPGDTNNREDVFVHDRSTGMTRRVSVNSSGGQGNNTSYEASISGDGRFVAFTSHATNLVPRDTNQSSDIFVHDLLVGSTTVVSLNSSGVQANMDCYDISISQDGRFVAFESAATNLVPGDTNQTWDIFVRDRQGGATTRVSVDSAGQEADSRSDRPWISVDGRFVVFESGATNLVPGDTNYVVDVFLHDQWTGITSRVSVDSSGRQGDSYSWNPSCSESGRIIAFTSRSTNLVAGDTNAVPDVYLHDTVRGTTWRASVAADGAQPDAICDHASISGDGRFVAFYSDATNLVPGDTNGCADVFVHGPYLSLEASAQSVSAGDTLTLTTWTGKSAGPVLLAVVDLNGSLRFLVVRSARFDPNGLWAESGTVPPGLSGNVVTFRCFGIAPIGEVDFTNAEAVTFQ